MDNNKHDEATSPPLHRGSTGHSGEPPTIGPLGNSESDGRSVDTSANAEDWIDIIPRPPALSIRSPARFMLGNFFIAMVLISLIIFIIFFAVTRFTLRDAQPMDFRVFSNSTGVSLCLYHDEWMSLITAVIAVDTR